METKDKHKELNDKMINLLYEHLGHARFGYMVGIVDMKDIEHDQYVITNMPEKYLFKYMVKATKQLAKNRGII